MANIVIVTDQLFLICKQVVHVALEEYEADGLYREIENRLKKLASRSKLKIKKEERPFQLIVNFIPDFNSNQNQQNNEDCHSVVVNVFGEEKARRLFKDIVQQLREQNPDHVFLDRMVEDMLALKDTQTT